MKIHIADNCGNSPRSLLAIQIAINLASNKYDKLELLLAEDFSWSVAGSNERILKSKLKSYMDKAIESKSYINEYKVLTSISHGKYAAVSSCAYASNGAIFNSHDLYEFTGAGSSAKLLKVTTYTVDSK